MQNLEETKKKMLEYTDLIGGKFDEHEIKNATNIYDLKKILHKHEANFIDIAKDCQRNLSNFVNSLNLE